ncbi:MAG TPA: SMP-30/gluconolactonase/LRE family protein [Pseudonocardiaceae bacterium]|jgi:sugar lactone lactonase YvrE|nr:SMP-30/gluconolactonase/LRE family protein [Pseudonocardiaceae bacterium]
MTAVEAVPEVTGRSAAVPIWDVGGASLLWVDAVANTVHRLHPGSGTQTKTVLRQDIGAAAPRMNGGLVCNLRDGVGLRDSDDRLTWLVYWQREGQHAACAAVDPTGRLWAATVREDAAAGGQLIRVEPEGRAKVVLADLDVVGGIGWSPAADRMYVVDPATRQVDQFDYHEADGEIDGRRPLCAITDGSPAGMCVDADGGVWVAIRDAGRIHRYTREGSLDRTLAVPAAEVTGCCFGGPDFTDLYITAEGTLFVARGIGAGLPTPRFPG